MVLFKLQSIKYFYILCRIYIPLWSYSNELDDDVTKQLILFTFHYGPIQITIITDFKTNINEFTFHYGPIQIISDWR